MKNICVIGTGISGATISNLLSRKYKVDVFDKAKGIGGRSAFRRYLSNVGFDHGLQYISPKTNNFKKFLNNLIKKKIVKKWVGSHKFYNEKVLENKNHIKLIGTRGNNSISKYLLRNINCNFGFELYKVQKVKKSWKLTFLNGEIKYYEGLIITAPFPQVKKLTIKFLSNFFKNKKIKMNANLTVMVVLNKTKNEISSYFFNDKILGWAARENSKRRFKYKYDLWTLQSTYTWANRNFSKYKKQKLKFINLFIKQFQKLTKSKIEKVYFSNIHGWKYSSNSKPINVKSYWNKSLKIGICGDWFNGPRYENGWISAKDLYKKITS